MHRFIAEKNSDDSSEAPDMHDAALKNFIVTTADVVSNSQQSLVSSRQQQNY